MWVLARVLSLYVKHVACLLRTLAAVLFPSWEGYFRGCVARMEVSSLNSWLHGPYMSVVSGVAESIT